MALIVIQVVVSPKKARWPDDSHNPLMTNSERHRIEFQWQVNNASTAARYLLMAPLTGLLAVSFMSNAGRNELNRGNLLTDSGALNFLLD